MTSHDRLRSICCMVVLTVATTWTGCAGRGDDPQSETDSNRSRATDVQTPPSSVSAGPDPADDADPRTPASEPSPNAPDDEPEETPDPAEEYGDAFAFAVATVRDVLPDHLRSFDDAVFRGSLGETCGAITDARRSGQEAPGVASDIAAGLLGLAAGDPSAYLALLTATQAFLFYGGCSRSYMAESVQRELVTIANVALPG